MTPSGVIESSSHIAWEHNNGVPTEYAVLAIEHTDTNEHIEIWYYLPNQYNGVTFDVLSEAAYTKGTNIWTLYDYLGDTQPGFSEIPSDYTQIQATLATIQNPIAVRTYNTYTDVLEDLRTDWIVFNDGGFNATVSGKNISFAMSFKIPTFIGSAEIIGHLKPNFTPPSVPFPMLSVRSTQSDGIYKDVGTLFVRSNGDLLLYMAKNVTYPIDLRIYGTWIIA